VHPVRGDVALAQPAAFTVVTGVRPWPSSSIRMWSGLARRSSNGDREVPELRAAAPAPVGPAFGTGFAVLTLLLLLGSCGRGSGRLGRQLIRPCCLISAGARAEQAKDGRQPDQRNHQGLTRGRFCRRSGCPLATRPVCQLGGAASEVAELPALAAGPQDLEIARPSLTYPGSTQRRTGLIISLLRAREK